MICSNSKFEMKFLSILKLKMLLIKKICFIGYFYTLKFLFSKKKKAKIQIL